MCYLEKIKPIVIIFYLFIVKIYEYESNKILDNSNKIVHMNLKEISKKVMLFMVFLLEIIRLIPCNFEEWMEILELTIGNYGTRNITSNQKHRPINFKGNKFNINRDDEQA